jgi:hypothetical protein
MDLGAQARGQQCVSVRTLLLKIQADKIRPVSVNATVAIAPAKESLT